MYTLYCRSFQTILKIFSRLLPWRDPEIFEGENSLLELPAFIKSAGIEKVLIVTDKGIASIGLMDELLHMLRDEEVDFVIYDGTVPNPTIDNIKDALQLYKSNDCQGIVAFGGGSPIDCAKGVGACIARPNKSISQMKGLFKVLKKIPPLLAIPTTAGTGSEATLAAVASDSNTHEKYALMDISLIPHVAVLDPLLTVKLPPHMTSTSGMDALTHAVEAYIGRSNTKDTKEWSMDAVKLVFDNLYEAYSNGENMAARANMQKAAYLGGKAFTRAYVGYVHAIAHTLGGFYNVPHGLANAVILPYVLEYYGESVHEQLAELADQIGICKPNDSNEQKAKKIIDAIKDLNESMDIPTTFDCILEDDIPLMVKRALKEANPLYPVPKILYEDDLAHLIQVIRV